MSGRAAIDAFSDYLEEEVIRQKEKHGEQPDLSDIEAHLIASEEFGEYSRAMNEVFYRARERDEMEAEMVQAAACLFRHWVRSRAREDAR